MGQRVGKHAFTTVVGMGSSPLEEVLAFVSNLMT